MAIDSKDKRQSLMGVSLYPNVSVNPAGSVSFAWRAAVGCGFSGTPEPDPVAGGIGKLVYGGLVNAGLTNGRLTG